MFSIRQEKYPSLNQSSSFFVQLSFNCSVSQNYLARFKVGMNPHNSDIRAKGEGFSPKFHSRGVFSHRCFSVTLHLPSQRAQHRGWS